MNETRNLAGHRIALLAADGFEKVELSVPLAALRVAKADVEVISLRRGRIRGLNLHEPAGRVAVTRTVHEADPAAYDALFIPGGFISPDLLRQSADARAWAQAFDEDAKPIATLCHGLWLLASAGLLEGRTVTSWPGIRDDVVNAGGVWLDRDVVRDGNLLTGRGPQDLVPFVDAMLRLFAEPAPILASPSQSLRSDPPRDAPPPAMLTALGWAPRPTLRPVANKRRRSTLPPHAAY
jgi:protease I